MVYGEGFVIDDEEFHEGNVCVVVPARNYRGGLLQQCEYTASKGVGSQVGNAGNLLKK